MYDRYLTCPREEVFVGAAEATGPLELWRHGLGHGGINHLPLPERVVEGVARLKPRLLRIFIQEFFRVHPAPGRFDWSRLDPYMDSLARTGAHVVAAITIKPRVLFPTIDQRVWMPNDVRQWQDLIFRLVRRYSVERPIVTHWEIGNETDIGENGGCPYLVKESRDYFELYRMTVDPVLRAFPEARVGGPACCWAENEPLPGLVELCAESGTRLDFISWHAYHDDPAYHARGVEKARALLKGFPGRRPEMMVTEMNKGFDAVSVEDLAFEPRRAAALAANILALHEAGLDASFYYHTWDQVLFRDDFARFFAETDPIMTRHWNEAPHRFGLFGVNGEVRPQYFLYQMLARMGDARLAARTKCADLRTLAGRDGDAVAVLVANYNVQASADRVVTVRLSGLRPGPKTLTVFRIDDRRRWDERALELVPLECRATDTPESFACQVFCPADCVALLRLEPLQAGGA